MHILHSFLIFCSLRLVFELEEVDLHFFQNLLHGLFGFPLIYQEQHN
jgi:hypothetical protein